MTETQLEWTRWHHAVPGGASFYFQTAPLHGGITVIRFVASDGDQCEVPRGVTCWQTTEHMLNQPLRGEFFTLGIEPYELRLNDKPFFRLVPQLYARQEPCAPTRTVQIAHYVGK